jgi:hypothetical protein
MPRGIPNAGKRETDPAKQTWRPENQVAQALMAKVPFRLLPEENPNETREEASKRILVRFGILEEFAEASTTGDCRSLIVSGPPGLGKSFTTEQVLKTMDPGMYSLIKGYIKTTGLIRAIWKNRQPGNLIVLDDADMIFKDENSLNLLKAVCDTCEDRTISYITEAEMFDDNGDAIPKTFSFEGSVIFLTNLDFDAMIERGHALSEHMAALVSRSHYIDLSMKCKRDFLIRIEQVMKEGLLKSLPVAQQSEVYDWIVANKDQLRELSLRMAIKVANVRKTMPHKWQDIATVTCCKVI